MKDIEISIEDNFVTIKYYDEESKMSFGRDPSLHPTKEMILEVLEFLLYLIKVKHNGRYMELKLLEKGLIEFQGKRFSGNLGLFESLYFSNL